LAAVAAVVQETVPVQAVVQVAAALLAKAQLVLAALEPQVKALKVAIPMLQA
jgi:hypothetical protein